MTRAKAFALKLRILGGLSLETPHSAAWMAGDIERPETQIYYYLRQLAEDGFAEAVAGRGGGYIITAEGRRLLAEALGKEVDEAQEQV